MADKDDEPLTKLKVLKERHQQLDDEADGMSKLRHLSSTERNHLKYLKISRLRCRDLIDLLEKEIKNQ